MAITCILQRVGRIRSQVSALRNIFQMYVLQISDIGLTLNPRAGERAILIKNFEGDWGLVTGKWIGFKNGVAGRKGTLSLSICFGCHALSAFINIKDYHAKIVFDEHTYRVTVMCAFQNEIYMN